MKKLTKLLCLLLCVVMVAGLLPATASAATTKVNQIKLTMETPALGKKPAATATSESPSSEFVSIEWYGALDANGCFKANTVYSAKIVMKIKDEYTDRIFKTIEAKNLIINGTKCSNGQVGSEVSEDGRTVTLAYILPHMFTESGSKKSVGYINVVDVIVDIPEAGRTPATVQQVNVSDGQVFVKDVKWSGTLDSQGRFIAGNEYTAEFLLGIKPGERLAFATAPWMYESHMTVNGKASQEAKAYYDCQQASVFYTFTALGDISAVPETDNVKLTITPPAVGELPHYNAKVAAGWNSYVTHSEWIGNFDEYGRFQAGETYTFKVTTKVDPTKSDFVYKSTGLHLINDKAAVCEKISDGGKTMTVSYTFPPLTGTAAAITGTPVSGFQPGDHGTMKVSGSAVAWLYEDATKDSELVGTKSGKTLLVLSAFVKDNWCAVMVDNKLMYVEHGDVFSDYVKYGSGSVEPYRDLWQTAEAVTGAQPITELRDLPVSANLGENPRVSDEYKGDDHMYYLSDISWNCDGPLQPYIWAEVVITCKAKEGYYFAQDVEYNPYSYSINVPQKLRYVDDKTVELTYYEWISGRSVDQGVTDAMKLYNELHPVDDPFAYPTFGTAKLYAPIDDTYQISESWRIYDYPSSRSLYLKGDVTGVIKILDWDLTDEIPELTGDWCRISYARTTGYVPKGVLTDVKLSDFWEGAPAQLHNSPFKFAGGSGTKEDPYLIATAEQLDAVRKDLDAHYKLIADIDLSGWGNWVPIGGTPAFGAGLDGVNTAQFGGGAFIGGFDGNGHVISGMTIEVNRETPYMQGESNSHFYGLFAMAGEATIKNLGLVNYNIDLNYTAAKKNFWIWIGAFSGWVTGGSMTNCYAAGGNISVNVQVAEGSDAMIEIKAGGLTGEVALADIKRCYNASDITVKCNKPGYLAGGGICGNLCKAWIVECFNAGDISLPVGDVHTFWRESFVGGITAEITPNGIENTMGKPKELGCYIWNCYNVGHLTANTVAGIYVSNNSLSAGYVENCYNIGKMTCNSTALDGYTMPRKADILSSWTSCCNSTYVKNCYANGNGVSGDAWQKSAKLGRMVLKAIPEDTLDIPDNGPTTPFNDVPEKEYYFEPVLWAVEKKITAGTSATTFSPNQTCTRAQILTFLWRAVGSPKATGTNPFTDVKTSDYFYDAAIWAYGKGMVSGNKFAGNTPCTRIETVIYLWKNAGAPRDLVYGSFLDLPDIPDAPEAVGWAVAYGITLGTSATTFSPNQTCTRGQIVTFLYRAIK